MPFIGSHNKKFLSGGRLPYKKGDKLINGDILIRDDKTIMIYIDNKFFMSNKSLICRFFDSLYNQDLEGKGVFICMKEKEDKFTYLLEDSFLDHQINSIMKFNSNILYRCNLDLYKLLPNTTNTIKRTIFDLIK